MIEWNLYEFATQYHWDDVAHLSASEVSDVCVVGDVHGTKQHLSSAIDLAVDLAAGAIVQVGDFWLSDRHGAQHRSKEAEFMWEAHESPVPVVVLDGNHEDWPALSRYAQTPIAQEVIATRRPLHLGGSLWWAWRGSTWTWSGLRCAALGGAVSPDRRDRSVRRWRWPEEALTPNELDRFVANVDTEHDGKLDVLFTHDAPAQVRRIKGGMGGIPWETQHSIQQMRLLLDQAVDHTQPRLVIHGHWHRSHRERISPVTESVGLANDGRRDNIAWLTAEPELHVSCTN